MCECAKSDPTMTMAMLGAAALLALWMIMRGGLKMPKGQATNILAVVVVVGIVAGAAWYRSQRGQAPETDVEQPAVSTQDAPNTSPGKDVPDETVGVDESRDAVAPASQPAPVTAAQTTSAPASAAALPRLVDLGADKCIPCKKLAPILEELRKEYAGRMSVEFIDVWENPGAGKPYNIRLIPTQILYDRDGKEVWRHEGFIPKKDLQKLVAEKVGVK
jgi:thioredoxin 1